MLKMGPWKTRKHRKHYTITVNTKTVTKNTDVSSKNTFKMIVHTFKYIIPNFYAYWMRIEGAVAYLSAPLAIMKFVVLKIHNNFHFISQIL
jgi:hypothetical protein